MHTRPEWSAQKPSLTLNGKRDSFLSLFIRRRTPLGIPGSSPWRISQLKLLATKYVKYFVRTKYFT